MLCERIAAGLVANDDRSIIAQYRRCHSKNCSYRDTNGHDTGTLKLITDANYAWGMVLLPSKSYDSKCEYRRVLRLEVCCCDHARVNSQQSSKRSLSSGHTSTRKYCIEYIDTCRCKCGTSCDNTWTLISRCNIGVHGETRRECGRGRSGTKAGRTSYSCYKYARQWKQRALTYAKPAHDIPSKVGPRTRDRSIQSKDNVNEEEP